MTRGRFTIYIYLGFVFMLFFLEMAFYRVSEKEKIANHDNSNHLNLTQYIIFILTAFFLFVVFAAFLKFVRITKDGIRARTILKTTHILADEISSINLFEKAYTTSASANTLVIKIESTSGKKILINDILYSNTPQLRKVLSETFPDKIVPYKLQKQQRSSGTIFIPETEKFSGNPHTSLNGLFFYATVLVFIFIYFNTHFEKSIVGTSLILIPVVYLLSGIQFYYFIISDQTIIIKNHFFIWVNKKYDMKDIIEMNFEARYRRSKGLRITTSNFKSKVYPAGSLRNKTWSKLKKKLKDLNIYFVDAFVHDF